MSKKNNKKSNKNRSIGNIEEKKRPNFTEIDITEEPTIDLTDESTLSDHTSDNEDVNTNIRTSDNSEDEDNLAFQMAVLNSMSEPINEFNPQKLIVLSDLSSQSRGSSVFPALSADLTLSLEPTGSQSSKNTISESVHQKELESKHQKELESITKPDQFVDFKIDSKQETDTENLDKDLLIKKVIEDSKIQSDVNPLTSNFSVLVSDTKNQSEQKVTPVPITETKEELKVETKESKTDDDIYHEATLFSLDETIAASLSSPIKTTETEQQINPHHVRHARHMRHNITPVTSPTLEPTSNSLADDFFVTLQRENKSRTRSGSRLGNRTRNVISSTDVSRTSTTPSPPSSSRTQNARSTVPSTTTNGTSGVRSRTNGTRTSTSNSRRATPTLRNNSSNNRGTNSNSSSRGSVTTTTNSPISNRTIPNSSRTSTPRVPASRVSSSSSRGNRTGSSVQSSPPPPPPPTTADDYISSSSASIVSTGRTGSSGTSSIVRSLSRNNPPRPPATRTRQVNSSTVRRTTNPLTESTQVATYSRSTQPSNNTRTSTNSIAQPILMGTLDTQWNYTPVVSPFGGTNASLRTDNFLPSMSSGTGSGARPQQINFSLDTGSTTVTPPIGMPGGLRDIRTITSTPGKKPELTEKDIFEDIINSDFKQPIETNKSIDYIALCDDLIQRLTNLQKKYPTSESSLKKEHQAEPLERRDTEQPNIPEFTDKISDQIQVIEKQIDTKIESEIKTEKVIETKIKVDDKEDELSKITSDIISIKTKLQQLIDIGKCFNKRDIMIGSFVKTAEEIIGECPSTKGHFDRKSLECSRALESLFADNSFGNPIGSEVNFVFTSTEPTELITYMNKLRDTTDRPKSDRLMFGSFRLDKVFKMDDIVRTSKSQKSQVKYTMIMTDVETDLSSGFNVVTSVNMADLRVQGLDYSGPQIFDAIHDLVLRRGVHSQNITKYIKKLVSVMAREKRMLIWEAILCVIEKSLDYLDQGYKYIDIGENKMIKISLETKEQCHIAMCDPPYVKIHLACGHALSLMAIYGIVYESKSDDTESILCPMCRSNLIPKLVPAVPQEMLSTFNVKHYKEKDIIASVKLDDFKFEKRMTSGTFAKQFNNCENQNTYISNIFKPDKDEETDSGDEETTTQQEISGNVIMNILNSLATTDYSS